MQRHADNKRRTGSISPSGVRGRGSFSPSGV
ncbi:hypothetical protein STRAU_6155 [Streptomyces aurantiacus JA 4570]|uniref:Uncharacterized protein n=1 Tax=Streptomyces aurantiacus JA 4570 TaxID=1286094 RepID=S3ZAL5_9ACTN|nr:hypothetical protein STRAU_6155 [Streptomyces aurantiacus JA 4570]